MLLHIVMELGLCSGQLQARVCGCHTPSCLATHENTTNENNCVQPAGMHRRPPVMVATHSCMSCIACPAFSAICTRRVGGGEIHQQLRASSALALPQPCTDGATSLVVAHAAHPGRTSRASRTSPEPSHSGLSAVASRVHMQAPPSCPARVATPANPFGAGTLEQQPASQPAAAAATNYKDPPGAPPVQPSCPAL